MSAEKSILVDLYNIVGKEEMFWRQRSRLMWMKERDKNTRFFHLSTMKHKTANKVSGINKGDITLGKDKEIENEAISSFSLILNKEYNLGEEDYEENI